MSIGPRVTIGKGVRIKDSIILDNVQIGVSHSHMIHVAVVVFSHLNRLPVVSYIQSLDGIARLVLGLEWKEVLLVIITLI